jgi:hypothetical protein
VGRIEDGRVGVACGESDGTTSLNSGIKIEKGQNPKIVSHAGFPKGMIAGGLMRFNERSCTDRGIYGAGGTDHEGTVPDIGGKIMKRDMDLIRELLLKLEAYQLEMGDAVTMTPESPSLAVPGYDAVQINHHMDLIHEAGFINDGGCSQPMLGFIFCGLTWKGHEFLDTVRDPEVWRRTNEGAKKIGSASIDLLFTLCKAYAKELLQEKLGIHLP